MSNQNALGALRAFAERKLKVPHDISLVTFDDAPFAEYLASPLSVVRQDIEAIGHCAAELLIEQIRTGRKPQQLLHRVPVEFVQRDSIGPPKRANALVTSAWSVRLARLLCEFARIARDCARRTVIAQVIIAINTLFGDITAAFGSLTTLIEAGLSYGDY